MNLTKKLLLIGLTTLIPAESGAQLPFFTGQRAGPTKYALENRAVVSEKEPKFTNILVAKTFRTEIPFWGYVGSSYNDKDGLSDLFYGAGPMVNIKNKLYTLATAEGSKDKFTGAALYSTLLFGKDFHADIHPRFDKKLDYNSTTFNIGKTYKGFTFGISSELTDGKIGSKNNNYFRIAKVKKGNFIDMGLNPKNKKIRFAAQKAF